MSAYIPHTPDDVRAMLETIGTPEVEGLFSDIPSAVRARYKPLGLRAHDDLAVHRHVTSLAERSTGQQLVPFLGAGLYDHFIPPVVGHILSRSEFFTAYTPYQAEISQGTLTWMFEYQTMICELTGMEVANASMYDGATALAEAVLMAHRTTRGKTVLLPRSLHPRFREVVATYAWGAGLIVREVPYDANGQLALGEIPADTCALVVQQPNALGVLEEMKGLKERLGAAFLIACTLPIPLAVIEPPGACGADVVVGEGQSLGNPLAFGGPLLGFFATRMGHLRRMPGRVSGQTQDADGNTGYVMTFQTREQHIRREGATSNICTNSALCALAATVYLAALGPGGLRRVALLSLERAHTLADRIAALPGYSLAFGGPFFHEFVVRCADPQRAVTRLRQAGIGVLPPSHLHPLGIHDGFSVAVTEKRTLDDLDRFVAALEEA